ncbi:Alcohol dehydrogenase 1 OS=Neurospora crassa (strain ATCC 24698 / 74-OR23-1A / CBS 708,71 / DSM 1257 / FGSC 987) GN=adh-1 PE=3 SV=1 [Rhizoctonia solani AG-1 IB]|uniref:Alcohol dehydrogenase 1 n=1 Tax=Thanatephorus cucumeris (strain AG1-IB / isolate 7/3/14) TaxID=1108050 RepID=A0A0B7FDG9_THACB|nr:Alcohol dehydrogenase 1 OS=Neurospora crassa (strain ATCC 24698 / 74-OR23-1A / CBS 708,71 / DSM 1257 / FGSC 987) GN=adh-1 PE=3 SV=1 [Rhizoctonia solani AG-1 IB]
MCPDIERSGFSVEGTFQQYVVRGATHLIPIPESLPLHLAAPILCAGISVYGALKQSSMEPGDIVVITGAGGGLGHLAIQYAVNAFGLRVIAVDTGDSKKKTLSEIRSRNFR